MKKLIMTVLTLLTCGAAYALPVGNPGEASLFLNGLVAGETACCNICDPCFRWCDAWSIRLGFYGDYVFDRHLESEAVFDRDLQDSEIFTNAEYIAINMCNRVDVFATFGVTDFSFRQNSIAFGAVVPFESELFFSPHFSWSIGGRATLWECGCYTIGIEGQYFRCNPDLDHFVNYNTGQKVHFNNVEGRYHEWQVGLGASYRVATNCPNLSLVPYVAVKYSRAHFDLNQTFATTTTSTATPVILLTIDDFQTKKHWGYAVGISFTMCDMAGITIEGRFADEKALYVNGQIRF